MEDNHRPLLSICIPTYNRSDVLEKCLDSIVTNSSFDSRVEVVISDNCSTDNTRNVVERYINRYKNISYYCNKENIGGERNFIKSLSLGKGEFIKLWNDYSVVKDKGLDYLLYLIDKYKSSKPVLLFPLSNNTNEVIICSSFDDVVSNLYHGLSWIGIYGFWYEDFHGIKNKENHQIKIRRKN